MTVFTVGAGSNRVIPKTLKMVVVAACMLLSMKYELRNIDFEENLMILKGRSRPAISNVTSADIKLTTALGTWTSLVNVLNSV